MFDPAYLDSYIFEFSIETGDFFLKKSLITGQHMLGKCSQDIRDTGVCSLRPFIISYTVNGKEIFLQV